MMMISVSLLVSVIILFVIFVCLLSFCVFSCGWINFLDHLPTSVIIMRDKYAKMAQERMDAAAEAGVSGVQKAGSVSLASVHLATDAAAQSNAEANVSQIQNAGSEAQASVHDTVGFLTEASNALPGPGERISTDELPSAPVPELPLPMATETTPLLP